MAWDDELVIIVRGLLQDYPDPETGDPPKYADDRLAENILIAAQNVQRRVRFSQTYAVNLTNGTLKPDPTQGTRDEDFINLVSLKTVCTLVIAEGREMTAQGISVQDGTSKVSLSRNPQSMKLVKESYCEEYENALYLFAIGGSDGAVGEAIVGPYKFMIGGNWPDWYPYGGPPNRIYRNTDREDWYGCPPDVNNGGRWY